MSNRVEQYDLISKEALGTVADAKKQLISTLDVIKLIASSGVKMNQSFKAPKGLEDTIKITAQVSDNTNKLVQASKELESQQAKLAASQAREIASRTELNKQIQNTNKQTTENIQVAKAKAILDDKEAGTFDKLKASNKLLAIEKNHLNLETAEGTKRLKEIIEQEDKNNVALSKGHNEEQKRITSIGQYKGQLKELFEGLKSGEVGMGGFIKGLGAMGKAMLANPIVWFAAGIAAIVGLFKLFTEAMGRTSEGAARLGQVTSFFKGIIDGLMIVLNKVAIVLFDAFTKPKETIKQLGEFLENNLINRFKAFGVIGAAIGKVFSKDWKDGLKDLSQGFIQLGTGLDKVQQSKIGEFVESVKDQMSETTKKAQELDKAERALAAQERKDVVENSELTKQSAALRAKAEELKKKDAEKSIQLQSQAFNLDAKVLENDLKILRSKLNIAKLNMEVNGASEENKKQIAEAEAALNNKEAEFDEQKRGRLRMLNRLRLEAFKQENERQKSELEVEKTKDEAIISANNLIADNTQKSYDERTAALKKNVNIQSDLIVAKYTLDQKMLDKQLELQLISQDDYNMQTVNLQQSTDNELEKLQTDSSKKIEDINRQKIEHELNEIEEFYATQAIAYQEDEGLFSTNAYKKQKAEEKLAHLMLQNQKDMLQAEIDSGKLTVQEKEDAAKKIKDIDHQIFLQGKSDDEKALARKKAIKDMSIQLAGDAMNAIGGMFDAQAARLEDSHKRDLARTKEGTAQRIAADAKYDAEKRKIERKQAVLKRIQGLFDVGINTATAITGMIANPGGVAGIILSIIAGGIGAAQIATILSTPMPAYRHGGTVQKTGFAKVSEEGRELAIDPRGHMFLTPDSESAMTLEKGTKIITHPATQRLLERQAYANILIENNKGNKILEQIRDKDSDYVSGGYRYSNKRGVKGKYAC